MSPGICIYDPVPFLHAGFGHFVLIASTPTIRNNLCTFCWKTRKCGANHSRRSYAHHGRNFLGPDELLFTGASQDSSVCIVSASRLIFAVARDGVLPMSDWISQVNSVGQPTNAITVVYILVAITLCAMLPSQVAFLSLVSASTLLLIASYGLICLLRLTMTPDSFKSSFFYLGRFRKLFYFASVLWNAFLVAVR